MPLDEFSGQRRSVSISSRCRDSWEFRKLCPEGSVLPNAIVCSDVDNDGEGEYVLGTTEGHVIVVKPNRRMPIHSHLVAATISVVIARPQVIITIALEGQCEKWDFTTAEGGISGTMTRQFNIPANCTCADLGTDERLYLGSSDRRVYAYDVGSKEQLGSAFLKSQVFSLKFLSLSPPGTGDPVPLLLVGTTSELYLLEASDEALQLWSNLSTTEEDFPPHESIKTGSKNVASTPKYHPAWSWMLCRSDRVASQTPEDSSCELNQRKHFQHRDPQRVTLIQGMVAGDAKEWPRQPTRLPVAVDCVVLDDKRRAVFTVLTEDGYCWLFQVWIRGALEIEQCESEEVELHGYAGYVKPMWSRPPALLGTLVPRVSLLRLPGGTIRVIALGLDGVLYAIDGQTVVTAQIKEDACSFALPQNTTWNPRRYTGIEAGPPKDPDEGRYLTLELVCVAVDELSEYVVHEDLHRCHLVFPARGDSSPTRQNAGAVHDEDEEEDVAHVSRWLFPSEASEEARRRFERLLRDGYSCAEWEALARYARSVPPPDS